MAAIGSPYQLGRISNEALTKYRFVNVLSSDDTKVELTDAQADNDWALGITEHDTASGEHVSLRVVGVFKLECGEAIATGAYISPGAAGVGAVPDADETPRARALETASASGDVIEVLLIDQQVKA